MAKTMEITDGQIRVERNECRCLDVQSATGRFALKLFMTMPVVIGVWSLASIVGAMMSCENGHTAGRALITAITGI